MREVDRNVGLGGVLLLMTASSCGDPECRPEFVGGGTYAITLSGDVRAGIDGEGSSRREIKHWLAGGNWADAVERYRGSGETIAMLGRPLSESPGYAGFVASQEIAPGTVEGCEAATFIATFVSEDERWLELLDAEGARLTRVTDRGPMPWDWMSYESDTGGEEFVGRALGFCRSTDERVTLTARVDWSLKERVKVREKAECNWSPY